MTTAVHTVIDSPLGDLTAVAADGYLTGLYFDGPRHGQVELGDRVETGFEETTRQLDEYFTGERRHFELPLAPRGETFDRRVWSLLTEIDHGRTRTYGQLARELGGPGFAQAVGAANGRNPIAVIVPCHRVIGADGNLTGYAGGLERKRFLLRLEEPTSSEAGRLF